MLVATSISSKEVVGFSSTTMTSPSAEFENPDLSNETSCYFAGAAIDKREQGNGLYHMLNRERILYAKDNFAENIFTRTQNPRVHEGITNSIYRPEPELGISLAAMPRVIVRNVYGQMLTADKPYARYTSHDDLNIDNGDAAIIT